MENSAIFLFQKRSDIGSYIQSMEEIAMRVELVGVKNSMT